MAPLDYSDKADPIGVLAAFLLLGCLVGYFLVTGINAQSDDPEYPRERRMFMVQKFGEELRSWGHRDMFGLHASKDWLPPDHEESVVGIAGG